MLRELISTKINEIFVEYQEANNITSGDIDPFDALQLDLIERGLEQLIEKVCAKQPKEMPASLYIYTDCEGNAHSVTYDHIDTDRFFYEISKRIAYDDLTNETVTDIYWRGMRIEYAGWQPCMKFEYKDLGGKTVWVGTFPEWDH
jgi:hypothetical protein